MSDDGSQSHQMEQSDSESESDNDVAQEPPPVTRPRPGAISRAQDPYPNILSKQKRTSQKGPDKFVMFGAGAAFKDPTVVPAKKPFLKSQIKRRIMSTIEEKVEGAMVVTVDDCIHIFRWLNREDLDRCELVSRSWYKMIHSCSRDMARREVEAVEISCNGEFQLVVHAGNRKKTVSVKKYFFLNDIDGLCVEKNEVHYPPYRYPCGHTTYDEQSGRRDWMTFGRNCRGKQFLIYRPSANYQKKLFTPPLEFFEQLAFVLKYSHVRLLVLRNVTLTQFFADSFAKIVAPDLKMDVVALHNVSLKHISPQRFHRFLGHELNAHTYMLEHLRNCEPEHVDMNLLLTPNLVNCANFMLGVTRGLHAPSRAPRLRFSVFLDHQAFASFIRARIDQGVRRSGFFRAYHGLGSDRFIVESYRDMFLKTPEDKRSSLFTEVIFDDVCFSVAHPNYVVQI